MSDLRGKVGVHYFEIMENEFACSTDKGVQDGHFAAKFVKKYRS